MLDDKIKVLEAIKKLFYIEGAENISANNNNDIDQIASLIDIDKTKVREILFLIYKEYKERPEKFSSSGRGDWITLATHLDIIIDNYKQQKEDRERKDLVAKSVKNSAEDIRKSAEAAVSSADTAKKAHHYQKISIAISVIVIIISILTYINAKKSQSDIADLHNRVTTIEKQSNPTPSTP